MFRCICKARVKTIHYNWYFFFLFTNDLINSASCKQQREMCSLINSFSFSYIFDLLDLYVHQKLYVYWSFPPMFMDDLRLRRFNWKEIKKIWKRLMCNRHLDFTFPKVKKTKQQRWNKLVDEDRRGKYTSIALFYG